MAGRCALYALPFLIFIKKWSFLFENVTAYAKEKQLNGEKRNLKHIRLRKKAKLRRRKWNRAVFPPCCHLLLSGLVLPVQVSFYVSFPVTFIVSILFDSPSLETEFCSQFYCSRLMINEYQIHYFSIPTYRSFQIFFLLSIEMIALVIFYSFWFSFIHLSV